MRDVVIHVCVTCRREGEDSALPRPGERLFEGVASLAPTGNAVLPVACLGNCRRSCSVAMAAPLGWTYVFGDLTAESAGDVVLAARLLADAPDGLMPWRGRPEAFKRGLVARIPPPPPAKDAAE
jgi:predicted metal-binding protein